MVRKVVEDPLLRKRKDRAVIGHSVTYELCLDCWEKIDEIARPYVERASEEIREGDEYGVPYTCHKCGGEIKSDDTTQIAS